MRSVESLEAEQRRLEEELAGVSERYAQEPSPGLLERANRLKAGIVHTREQVISALAEEGHERNREPGADFRGDTPRTPSLGEDRDAALRLIEQRSADLSSAAGDRLDSIIRRDRTSVEARYLLAVSDPLYERAFWRIIGGEAGAASLLSPEEARAVQRVGEAMAERALQIGEGKYGGYAVPFTLDPTILLTSTGAVNPLRQVASVQTITGSEWKGISSAGVEAHFAGELEEVADDTPEIAQPTIKPEKAHVFVPFSIEAGEDWTGLEGELRRLFADAKETLEATKFAVGSGTKEPYGIVTGATEVVETAEAGKLGVADLYTVQAALPSRFQPNASWLTSLAVANATYRLVGGGSTEPPPFNDARDRLLMKPWRELSTLDSKVETGKRVAIYGDIAAGFKIVDRVGLSVELVPHLLGENRRPIGARGLYAYWRTGSKVVNKAALRTLKVK